MKTKSISSIKSQYAILHFQNAINRLDGKIDSEQQRSRDRLIVRAYENTLRINLKK